MAAAAGLTVPNGPAQQAMLKQAFDNARVSPLQISYVEAHGTGTALGDPIEVEALAAVIGKPRSDGSTCRLGSVKTNFGHLEAAAGVAGLIKVVLVMKHQAVPPLLHFKKLNPLISLDEILVVTIGHDGVAWPAGAYSKICRGQFLRIWRDQRARCVRGSTTIARTQCADGSRWSIVAPANFGA